MKLIVIGSSSSGNSYALQAESGEILLLEAGIPLKEVKKAIEYQTSKVVGCLVSHIHADHCKCAKEYMKAGIDVYSNSDVCSKADGVKPMDEEQTYYLGDFCVTPFSVKHDVMNFGFLVRHQEMGVAFFATDCYDLRFALRGCNTILAECNYSDELLDKAIKEGNTPRKQGDRVMLSHMSLEHCVSWLHQCEAEKSAKQIILIHGSSRHLDSQEAVTRVQKEFGVPVFYAKKGLTINLM